MTSRMVPPQAYTKETLGQAYMWLQSQPESIKELCRDPQQLISFFLTAKKNGTSLEQTAPVSTESFRNDLKNLADELHQFGNGATSTENPQTFPQAPASISPTFNAANIPTTGMGAVSARGAEKKPAKTTPTINELDAKSRELVRDAARKLNLSSETEALRALISIGHRKISSLLE